MVMFIAPLRLLHSLKEAKKRSKKEVSTDDEQLGKGFRAPKPKDYYSPDTSVPRRRMDKDQYEFPPTLESMNNCVAPVTVERMNSFLPGEHYVNTVISNRQNHIDIVEPTNLESVNSEETLLTELGVLSDADEISSSGRSAAKVDRLEEKFDKIIEILSEHKLMLEELMGQCQKEKSSLEPFAFDLPLGNLEDIMSLEGKLADKTFLALFVKDLENVGGNGPKDFVCRLLKTVFTNQLGELCSWTGVPCCL
ncbi:uncharacterized protein LOC111691871 isoform X2 [Anoplophora glabripennis]|uniref:uncharacterized protein LOC111691871 isoform X2 n=1 Tax=Anoplophora glabripennis TaxID=217634 RepID=UPI000C78B169|nr:uncharacterized protein LOC111691871 isoform X2 [Anoplophora glabripennis]